jgi:proline iminopeptidase
VRELEHGASRIIGLGSGHHVWTRRVGRAPTKMLTLHGGPGCTHEYFEVFEDHLDSAEIELYYYDQLGSYYSDQPHDTGLWTVDRFRSEVEEVRTALGLEGFFLFGNSWGGMLGIEYALHHQEHLKGLIVSNMTASIPSYVRHVNELRDRLPRSLVDEMQAFERAGDYEAPRYQELLTEHLYKEHICRLDPWPPAVQRCMDHLALPVYNTMQGPNEFVVTGTFADWDRWDDLARITVPTLLVVGRHDTMRVEDVEEMGRRMPNARVHVCENGSHMPFWDDAEDYFATLRAFVREVESGGFR